MMMHITLKTTGADLRLAAQQESLRWQGYLARVPLFLITLLLLYSLGIGLLRNTEQMTLPLQIFVLIGYSVFYWLVFMLGRTVRAWFRMRTARRARFRKESEHTLELSLAGKILILQEGDWQAHIPIDKVYSSYTTKGFVFLDCPFLPWLPLPKSDGLIEFLSQMKKTIFENKEKGWWQR